MLGNAMLPSLWAVAVLQGDLRFVLTVKGSRILLSVKSAAEELKPVLAEAKDFNLLSFKVPKMQNNVLY